MPGNKSKPRKSISFAENDQVRETCHRNDLQEHGLADQWLQEQDFEGFRNNCKETLSLMQQVGIRAENEQAGICFHGLENYTGVRKTICKTRRASAYRAVLSEQDRQWDLGVCDPEGLKTVYQDTSAFSQRDASIVGMRHQDEVLPGRRAISKVSDSHPIRRELTLRRDTRWSTSAIVA
jgi:hypothetical protein